VAARVPRPGVLGSAVAGLTEAGRRGSDNSDRVKESITDKRKRLRICPPHGSISSVGDIDRCFIRAFECPNVGTRTGDCLLAAGWLNYSSSDWDRSYLVADNLPLLEWQIKGANHSSGDIKHTPQSAAQAPWDTLPAGKSSSCTDGKSCQLIVNYHLL
jgi:hypothetical protein